MQRLQALAQSPQGGDIAKVLPGPDPPVLVLHDQKALGVRLGGDDRWGDAGDRGRAVQGEFALAIDPRSAPGRSVQPHHEAAEPRVDAKHLVDAAAAERREQQRRLAIAQARHARQRPGRWCLHVLCRRYLRSHSRKPNTAMIM